MNTTNATIQELLNELYNIDPDLKKNETALIEAIDAVLQNKPTVILDPSYKKRILEKLLEQYAQPKKVLSFNFMSYFQSHRLFAGLGVFVVAITAVSIYIYTQQPVEPSSQPTVFVGETKIVSLDAGAFGTLQQNPQSQSLAQGLGSADAGNLNQMVSSYIAPEKMAVGLGGGGDATRMMYNPVRYAFTYVGDTLELTDDMIPVYRRVMGEATTSGIIDSLKQVHMGIMDISSFKDLKLQQFSMYEDRDFGYSINVDVQNTMISIYEYWQRWQTPERTCTTENCYEQYRLQYTDVPSDDAVIGMATQFLQERGIDISAYGEPKVMNDWKVYYEDAVTRGEIPYVPDVVTVTFPEKIHDSIVYDESGSLVGLMVNVNVRHQRVSGAWNIASRVYEESEYGAVTDIDRLVTYVENGGPFQYYSQDDANATTVALEVGTPTVELVKQYRYTDGISEELYVPSLVFPVIAPATMPEYVYPPKTMIVPLVAEMFSERLQQSPPDIRPFIEPLPVDPAVETIENNESENVLIEPTF